MISFYPGYFGHLGNQMFQYATTFAASQRRGVLCTFPQNDPNLFELFTLSARKNDGVQGQMIYKEPHFHYSPIPHYDQTTLFGYFQSDKYFSDYADEVREEFTFRKEVEAPSTSMVSVHVRRGDYLKLSDHHPACTLEYYDKAMSKFDGCKFLIFSDDKKWCLENFNKENCEISFNSDAVEDLQLMSLCDHHIIANSSFSWWGAWLGRNKDKKVIAPKEWFGPAKNDHNTKDLYCKDWIVL